MRTFLELFDAYVEAREELRRTPDEECGPILTHCAQLWNEVIAERNRMGAAAHTRCDDSANPSGPVSCGNTPAPAL